MMPDLYGHARMALLLVPSYSALRQGGSMCMVFVHPPSITSNYGRGLAVAVM